MLSMMMDLDLTSTEDGFILKEQLNDNLVKNDEEQGKSTVNESKDPEEIIHMDTHEGFSIMIDLPVEAANDRPHSLARRSNSAGPLSPSEKAEEQVQQLTKESDLHNEFQVSNLVNSSEVPISMVEDYECHTKKRGPNAAGGLPYDNANEISTLGMQAGDSDPFLSESYHENRNLTLCHRQNGQFDTISIDCSSEIANNEDNKKDFGSIVDETKLKGGLVPSHEAIVVRESCGIHSPEKEKPVSGDLHDRSPETELFVRQGQKLPEVEEGKPSTPPKQLSFPDMERERSIMRSPVRFLDREASVSPERQKSSTLKRSPDKSSFSRPDQLPIEKGDKKPAHYRKHTPSPERNISGKKRASSHERLSPSVRRKYSCKTVPENANRVHSPKKHLSSPRRRVSPLKRGKAVSRSPVRRKDSSISRKDHKERSRSRSPNARDHYRGSSRRRHSPRRSPPSSSRSRHRSPKRPWSPPPNRSTGVGRPGRNLFVAGFSYATTERDLENKFSRFGHVRGVRIVRDKRSGESRGFGFVSLEKDEEADAAIRAVDRTEWNGRIVLVEKSKTPAR